MRSRSAAAFQPKPEWSKMEVRLWGYCFFPCRGFLFRASIVWKATAQNDLWVKKRRCHTSDSKTVCDFAVFFFFLIQMSGTFRLHPFQQGCLWKPLKRQTMLLHSVKLKVWFITSRLPWGGTKKLLLLRKVPLRTALHAKPTLAFICFHKANKSQRSRADFGNIFHKEMPRILFEL